MVYEGTGIRFQHKWGNEFRYGGTEIRFESVAAARTLLNLIEGWIAAQTGDWMAEPAEWKEIG